MPDAGKNNEQHAPQPNDLHASQRFSKESRKKQLQTVPSRNVRTPFDTRHTRFSGPLACASAACVGKRKAFRPVLVRS